MSIAQRLYASALFLWQMLRENLDRSSIEQLLVEEVRSDGLYDDTKLQKLAGRIKTAGAGPAIYQITQRRATYRAYNLLLAVQHGEAVAHQPVGVTNAKTSRQ